MNKPGSNHSAKPIADEFGNLHYIVEELARGGQGVVYRTKDADLAIKQPLDVIGQPDVSANLRTRFQSIRSLPMPSRIPVSLPLAILRDEPGYVMRLLNGMTSFNFFDLDGKTKKNLQIRTPALPQWLAGIQDKEMSWRLFHYATTGSTRRRLLALSKCASILARLHTSGLVYGDISPNNVFISDNPSNEVWLIDADNLRFELSGGGISAYTPAYGAPEVVRGIDSSRPRSDSWSFAVMAFKILSLNHPFVGKKVLEPDGDGGGWDAEPMADGAPADLDEKAFAGYFPFVDDEDDKSNQSVGGLPRELVATPKIRFLFQETFGMGRIQPHRRPGMGFWAMELARAFDHSLLCPACKMSYFNDNNNECPYCSMPCPAYFRAKTPRWEVLISQESTGFKLPNRLFHPFSFEHNDETECEAVPDFETKNVFPARGTKPFPDNLTFEYVEAKQ